MQKSTLSSYLHGFAFDVLPGNKLERDCFLTFSWFLFYGNVCSLKKNLWRRREVAIISLQIILYIFTRRDYYLLCQKFRFLLFHFSSSASSLFFFNSDTQKKRRQCSQQLSERHSSLLIWKLFKQNWEILMFLKCSYIYVHM